MHRARKLLWLALAAGPLLWLSVRAPAQRETAAPQLSDAEIEDFLLNAKILERKPIPVGITSPERATLSDGTLVHDAHVQPVDIRKLEFTDIRGTELNFRDSYKYNIAAYRLDRLLGLNMIPVSVERKVGGKMAAVTWWVDDVVMMDRDRQKRNVTPPRLADWNDQMKQVNVFNILIYNTDPNQGNLLITKDWRIWIVDFTRAFRTHKTLRFADKLAGIDRRFYDGLRQLDKPTLQRELGPYLRKTEIRALLARRDRILDVFDERIAERGEAAVICSRPGH